MILSLPQPLHLILLILTLYPELHSLFPAMCALVLHSHWTKLPIGWDGRPYLLPVPPATQNHIHALARSCAHPNHRPPPLDSEPSHKPSCLKQPLRHWSPRDVANGIKPGLKGWKTAQQEHTPVLLSLLPSPHLHPREPGPMAFAQLSALVALALALGVTAAPPPKVTCADGNVTANAVCCRQCYSPLFIPSLSSPLALFSARGQYLAVLLTGICFCFCFCCSV